MTKIKRYLYNELWAGKNWFDKTFMFAMLALQIIVFIIAPESPLSIIAGIAGVISVVLCAQGKISFYFIGFVQTISYLFLAWDAKFYGEVAENIFYLVTMVWGIFVWRKNMSKSEDGIQTVEAKKFTPLMWILSAAATILATIGMGYILTLVGSEQAYTDAATNVMAVFARSFSWSADIESSGFGGL